MNGERLRQARELCGLTQKELAQFTGLAQSAIAQIESGEFVPTPTVGHALAIQTGFDLSFLRNERAPTQFPEGSILHRSRARVSKKEQARARRLAQFLFEIAVELRERFRPISVRLPCVRSQHPVEAARLVRSHFGLSPDTPIPNITTLVERAGVMLLRVPLKVDGLDGFSCWAGDDLAMPTICLVGPGLGYRTRFTLSEELGHLVMHSPLTCTVKEAEKDVKQFVGEFVLPAEAMLREMRTPVTLSSLATMKPRWGASIQFLAQRSKELEIVTANQHRYLMQQISSRGWRRASGEPGDDTIPQEQPQLLRHIVQGLYGSPPLLSRIRDEFGIPLRLLNALFAENGIATSPPTYGVVEISKSSDKLCG
jgi:Zn-dependent peptidase ImmA (M78 family)/transcriptional regulator with XRE-family HTH domain